MRPGQDELRRPEFLNQVATALEQEECALRDRLGLLEVAALAVDLGERLRRSRLPSSKFRLDEDFECLLELSSPYRCRRASG